MTKDDVYAALHEVVGRCGHCGKRKCLGRRKHSVLPGSLSMNQLERALAIASKAIRNKPDQGQPP